MSPFDSLEKLNIQEGNTAFVEKNNQVLSSDMTKLIFCNDDSDVVTIPDTVISVESKAFNNKGAIKINIPKMVTYIDDTAFDGCTPIICGEKYSYAYDFALSHNLEFCYLGLDDNGKCGDNLAWSVDERGILRITGTGDMYDYTPWYGGNEPPWAKYSEYIKAIKIESNVTSIGEYAFINCRFVEDVAIADSVTKISNYAFDNCSGLRQITIPQGVSYIGTRIFESCDQLAEINVVNNNNSLCSEEGVLFDKKQEILIKYPPAREETQYNIPNTVYQISEAAFKNCNKLEKLIIPSSVKDVGTFAFDECINLNSVGPIGEDYAIEYCWKEKIPDYAFFGCDSLKKVKIADGIKSIGDCAFASCNNIADLLFNKEIKSIGNSAFSGCNNITKLILPDGIEHIGATAFIDCAKLSSIIVPKTVVDIGERAFANCFELTKIQILNSIVNIGSMIFIGCKKLEIYGYANSTAESYAKNNHITFIVLDKDDVNSVDTSTSNIGNADNTSTSISNTEKSQLSETQKAEEPIVEKKPALSNNNLDSGEIVTDIKSSARYQVSGNETVGFTAMYVGGIAKKAKTIVIPDIITVNGISCEVTAIDEGAFKGQKKLQKIAIGNNVTTIGNNAFKKCTSLKKVIIPSKVTTIGKNAFAGCKKLKKVIVKTKVLKKIGKNAFKGINKAAKIKVPKKNLTVYKKLFKKAKLEKSVKITK